MCGAAATARTDSQEYVIGADDVLSVSVWLHPELERTVTVSSKGSIVFPPLGEIQAAGLSARQLGDHVSDRLSTYLRQTATVTVTVTQYLSQSVFVSGAVARPGRYGFEHIPGVSDVINAAGGALPSADLGRVQIVKREGAARRTLTVDITAPGSAGAEVALAAGDAIVVPVSAEAAGPIADAAGVLGEVNHPGLYPMGAGQDLWMALALAGGATGRGDLSAIRVLAKDRQGGGPVRVNLIQTLERGNHSPYIVKPGDIVIVKPKGGGTWASFLQLLGVSRDVLGVVALAQVLDKQK
jgi:polysaccharide export outer membrane protein